jgi:hypothetical protein
MLLQGWVVADPSGAVALDHQPLPDPIQPQNLYNHQLLHPSYLHNLNSNLYNSHELALGEGLWVVSWVEY